MIKHLGSIGRNPFFYKKSPLYSFLCVQVNPSHAISTVSVNSVHDNGQWMFQNFHRFHPVWTGFNTKTGDSDPIFYIVAFLPHGDQPVFVTSAWVGHDCWNFHIWFWKQFRAACIIVADKCVADTENPVMMMQRPGTNYHGKRLVWTIGHWISPYVWKKLVSKKAISIL